MPSRPRTAWLKQEPLAWAALVAFAILLRFLPTLKLGFYADDFQYFDIYSTHPSFLQLVDATRLGGYLRPLAYDLYLPGAYSIFGIHPTPFHLVILACVMAAAHLVYRISWTMYGSHRAAGFAALLFGTSIVHATVIGWISCSADGFATLFALLATLWYLRGRTALSCVAYVLGVLTKEVAAVLPVALLFLGWSQFGSRVTFRRTLPHLVVMSLWAMLYAVLFHPSDQIALPSARAFKLPLLLIAAAAGFEGSWSAGFIRHGSMLLGILSAGVAAAWLLLKRGPECERGSPTWPWVVWIGVFTVPLIPVAHHYNAYYFTLALAGLYILGGALIWCVPSSLALAGCLVVLVLGQSSMSTPGNDSARPHLSALTLETLEKASRVSQSAILDIPLAIPVPADSSVFLFEGLPERNGVVMGSAPLLRAIYANRTLRGYYLGTADPESVPRQFYMFVWDRRNDRLQMMPESEGTLWSMESEAEITLRPRAARTLLRYQARKGLEPKWTRWQNGAWSDWNEGYLLWEEGDTVGANACWERAGRKWDGHASDELSAVQGLSPEERLPALFDVARAYPTDPLVLRASVLAALETHHLAGYVMLFRLCSVHAYDRPLLKWALSVFESSRATPAAGRVRELLRKAEERR
jgi:hypothetical protein